MHIIGEISEAQVIATFLQAEIDSPTWSKYILPRLNVVRRDRRIIDSPTFNETENLIRSNLLGRSGSAGYRSGLFIDFPKKLVWQRAVVDRAEMEQVRYINQDKWNRLSGDTGKAIDAAARIRSGFRESDLVDKILSTFQSVSTNSILPEIILVSESISAVPVALEGNTRITAYLMDSSTSELSVIIGFSNAISPWLQRKF